MVKKDDYLKVFDVSKPHKVAPSASSKPIIVGHHPVMADPMVTKEREQPKEQRHFLEKTEVTAPKIPDQPAQPPSVTAAATPTITPPSEGSNAATPPEKAYTTYETPETPPAATPVSDSAAPAVAPISEATSHEANQNTELNSPEHTPLVTTSTGAAANPAVAMPASSDQVLPEDPLRLPAGEAGKSYHHQILWWLSGLLILVAAGAFFVMAFRG